MGLRSWAFALTLVFVLVTCHLQLATAQSTSASLTGLVDDPHKALIVGAQVTAINTETGVKTSTTTNREGQYVLPNLNPGSYRIEVDKPGFKGIIEAGLTLHVQDVVQINFHMAIGSASETVSVNASEIQMNTTDGTVSTVVTAEMVKNMPLNGRSFQDLILLTPGVVQTGGGTDSGNSGEFSVNGQRTEENYYTVDGVSANLGINPNQFGFSFFSGGTGSVPSATALGTTQALVSVDALQEFRVQSSTYSAEYGRNPGGQFAFETKSGTNAWHGSAFDYLRNDYFDANDWFNDYYQQKGAPLRQNDFGGTLGGPVRIPHLYNGKDKTSFFVSYEGLRLLVPQPADTSFVPDASMRANTVAPLDRVLNAFPKANGPAGTDDTANGFGEFIGTWSNPSSLDSTTVRLDHVVSDKLRLFFRFADTRSSSNELETGAPQLDLFKRQSLRTYTAGASSTFSNHLGNEFRVNFSSNYVVGGTSLYPVGGAVPVDLAKLASLPDNASVTLYIFYGPYFNLLTQYPYSATQRQWNLVDTMSYSVGRHQLKFGADYRRLAPFQAPFNPNVIVFYETSEAGVVSNSPDAEEVQSFVPFYPLYGNFSLFAQDEWKVLRRLSLSLGLRWDMNPPPGVTQGLKPYTVQGTGPSTWGLAPQGTAPWKTTWFNFAPRLGAAYILHDSQSWETVMRGGGGVFFDTGQQLGSFGYRNPGTFSNYTSLAPQPFPEGLSLTTPSVAEPPNCPCGTLYGYNPHLQLPYTLQWNVAIEQSLGKSQALTASYVGSRASRLLQSYLYPTPSNPNAGHFYFLENGLSSDYHSLQLQLQRRLSENLTALASYTWSHCLDYGSSNFSILPYQRGNCDFDIRHNFNAAVSYDIPNVGKDAFVATLFHHWGVDGRFIARTAFPVGLNGNQKLDPVSGKVVYGGEDLVQGQPIYLYGSACASLYGFKDSAGQLLGCPGGKAINPCAFITVGGSPNKGCPSNPPIVGLAPRNFVRGFDAVQMNLAVRREFPVYENLMLQFRAEAFNVFNHPNFGGISTGGSNFGQATATLARSTGGLNSLYQTGGPRSMQFALKLIF